MEAFEALNIATINVLSVGMMLGGGLLYAFDISSLDDMRQYVRKSIGVDGPRMDEDSEKEIEEWIAKTLNIQMKAEKGGEKSKDAEEISTILERLSKLEEEKKGKRPNYEGGE
jgi:proteasome assembly chaperone (PAC2) family protein